MNILFTRGEEYQWSLIKHSKRDLEVKIIVQQNTNPLLGTRVYTADFPDGEAIKIAAKNAADSIL